MNPDPQQAKAIFLEAVEDHEPDQWPAFLDQACASQPELRRRVEVLLAAHREAGTAAQQAGDQGTPRREVNGTAEQPGAVIGPYKLLEQIGEGGMGTVWMAQQTEPVKRVVALKLIKAGMDSKQVIARFEAERQALALMDHTNIARVLDAGTTSAGRPYFVMDLVKGVPITKYCDEHHLTPRQRLELFIPVCQAVQHAHQKGIIHRDLKPSNVLVALYDGKPVPKVIDFGVAKAAGQSLTEKTLVTGFGNIVGTLEYMSPEQAEINQLDIDTRSDIYSLGVLLYELLAGSPPFALKEMEQGGMLEMLRVIREQEPTKPSTKLSTAEGLPMLAANRGTEPAKLTKLVRGELDWIVMKALEKDRSRRYETANGFAMDVQRYLADEPVLAGPPSVWYRVRKFARRNRARLAVAAVLGLLLLGTGAFGWYADQQAAHRHADAQRRDGEDRAWRGRNAEAVAALLKQCEDALRADRANRAALALTAADRRAAEGGGEELASRLARCKDDLNLLRTLDTVDADRFTRPPDAKADAARRRAALAAHGMSPVDGAPIPDVVDRVNASLIRDRVLTSLDLWLVSDHLAGVRAVLQAADADPYRDAVRDALVAGNGAALRALAEKPEALAQPARFAAIFGRFGWITNERRRTVLVSALRARSGDLFLLMVLSESYPESRRWAAERLRWLQAAVAAHPENAAAHNNLGTALDHLGDTDGAVAEYETAMRLDPTMAMPHTNLGIILYTKRDLDGAIVEYQKAHGLDPKSGLILSNWGQALARKKDRKSALAKHREAVEIDPNCATARIRLGRALSTEGNLEGAVDQFKAAIGRDAAKKAASLTAWGVALWKRQDNDGALAKYEEAIKADPDHGPAHTNRGVVLWNRNQKDEAMTEFLEGVRLDPADGHAHGALGRALQEKGDPIAALVHLRKAVLLEPEDADYPGMVGTILHEKGDVDGAIKEYKVALKIDPTLILARLNLANALDQQGKPLLALPLHQQLAAEVEKDGFRHKRAVKIVLDLIACHERLKQFDQAEIWLRKNLARVKGKAGNDPALHATALKALGQNLLRQEKWTDAEMVMRDCLAVYDETRANTWMRFDAASLVGAALLGQKKYEEAEPLLLEGYTGMKEREKRIPPPRLGRLNDAALRVVRLYEATDKADAAKWRAIREKHEFTRVGSVQEVGAGLKLQGKLDAQTVVLVYEVKLSAGKTYIIDMVSPNQKALDPYLMLKDADGEHLAEDDDGGEGLNARIIFTSARDRVYRIHATSFNAGRGAFTLTVREKK
ncbi:MAG TPA: tetratricopeptide repeat protein [Gemmataceae bacterium]|nr:tetratricopeptide repeat protein [Gemmataceae bacterium]